MSETEPPLLADVYPALVSFLDAAPVSEGESALAQIVGACVPRVVRVQPDLHLPSNGSD
ncbi:hypothetical protein OIC43_42425 [Streptomyces sp. NBC_00825]|uniref:hypothetical protein n=1 Tax=unclassified Streptomyces TaxID=2593676 RepID=UPI002259FE68|nr:MULTISPECIES: hypothetical protein [unclassified Streptomyces]WTB51916.1 hypothetical protein OG832_01255 [Streptomyces sp. NBC_00826]WTH95193.1 hypothetical protein OIC43_42425 [Streptomyces sp. NBC_00825]WTI03927.1 hypothetical protein OHA23_42400 [Streptomyces sp. NBC_00822]MCX4869510.1 hypothetical protein [Streptomyces sp. NBC_00906]MCX4900749.1 hypothetical protein [Streptomyces sp. NBC_00892]